MSAGFLACLLAAAAWAQEAPRVKFPYTFVQDNVAIRVPNIEVTSDRRNVLVHAFVHAQGTATAEVHWSQYFTVITAQGQRLSCSGDCGVDSGTGLHITMGPFHVDRKETRMLIYFPIEPSEAPVRIEFADGAVTARSYP